MEKEPGSPQINIDPEQTEAGDASEEKQKLPKKITEKDLRPEIPEAGKTIIVFQCNARDDREPDTPREQIGALTQESIEKIPADAKKFFNEIFNGLDETEREKVDVLVVASDAKLITPEQIEDPNNKYQRAIETGKLVTEGLENSISEYSLSKNQLLNSSVKQEIKQKGPVGMSELKDLLMLNEEDQPRGPEFVEWLKEQSEKDGKNLWAAYEDDDYSEKREEMEVEGPIDISNRVKCAMEYLTEVSRMYHNSNPDKRLIIWAVSHYDCMIPYIKRHIAGMNEKEAGPFVGISKGAGITIEVGGRGENSTTQIGDRTHEFSLDAEKTQQSEAK